MILKTFNAVMIAELKESLRAKWFFLYAIIFGGIIIVLINLGITESQAFGFTGLSRLLVTYIQFCIVVLPVYILITTVRIIVGERESNVLEYFLSMPISLASYYWGKLLARFLVIFLPVALTISGVVVWGQVKQMDVPWNIVIYYSLMLGTLTWCFLGLGIFISSLARKQEMALGLALLSWLILLVFIDIIMIALMLQHRIQENIIIGISLLNPLQTFRTGAILLFDPEMAVLGPASYVIIDNLGKMGFLTFSILYPFGLGWLFSSLGYQIFKRGDII